MGENKGHSDKAPSYPELNEMGSAASRAGQSAGNLPGNQQSADDGLDISGQQLESLQGGNQGGQSGGNQQQGQSQNEQRGGQHASGGTPALDDLNAREGNSQSGSQGNASQADWDQLQDQKQDR